MWLAGSRASRADTPSRILVVGDSQAQGLGAGLVRQFRRDRSVRVIDQSRIGTGLNGTGGFNWPTEIGPIAAKEPGSLAVVFLGANDRPPIRPKGKIDEHLSAAFKEVYGNRVQAMAETLVQACSRVIWVGHPVVRDTEWQQDIDILNEVFSVRAAEAGAAWFPTAGLFRDKAGDYTAYGKGLDGQTTRLRADDGVHLTPAGYDVMAGALLRFQLMALLHPEAASDG